MKEPTFLTALKIDEGSLENDCNTTSHLKYTEKVQGFNGSYQGGFLEYG